MQPEIDKVILLLEEARLYLEIEEGGRGFRSRWHKVWHLKYRKKSLFYGYNIIIDVYVILSRLNYFFNENENS